MSRGFGRPSIGGGQNFFEQQFVGSSSDLYGSSGEEVAPSETKVTVTIQKHYRGRGRGRGTTNHAPGSGYYTPAGNWVPNDTTETIEFKGELILVRHPSIVARAIEYLLSTCDQRNNSKAIDPNTDQEDTKEKVPFTVNNPVLGFDMEWEPEQYKGQHQNPIATIQLASEKCCVIFWMTKIAPYLSESERGIAAPLRDLLCSHSIVKVGHATDTVRLHGQYWFQCRNFVDLSKFGVDLGYKKPGLKGLSQELLGKNLSKTMTRSNWGRKALTEGQMSYAATDAWITRKLFVELERIHGVYRRGSIADYCGVCSRAFTSEERLHVHEEQTGHKRQKVENEGWSEEGEEENEEED